MQTSQAVEAVFLSSGDNPFKLIKDSIKYAFVFTRYNLLRFQMAIFQL